jgi:hypothetical protein
LGFYKPPPFVADDETTEGFPMAYQVTAPLVVAKDQGGHNRHYYYGSVLHYLNEIQKAHFLRKGLVREIPDFPPAAATGWPVEVAKPHGGKPPKAGTHEAWVEYAVSQGLSESEAKGKTKQELIDALG